MSPHRFKNSDLESQIDATAKEAQEDASLNDPTLFINRELSWLRFNDRVLEEATDTGNPLLERLRFITICESNLDEFFMVRVAGLKQKIANKIEDRLLDGLSNREQLKEVLEYLKGYYTRIYSILNNEIFLSLNKIGITFEEIDKLDKEEAQAVETYFKEVVYPVLTPLAIDPGHPFPRLANLSLNMGVILKNPNAKVRGKQNVLFAVVQVPKLLPRLFLLPSKKGSKERRYVWLEDIIASYMQELFSGYEIEEIDTFKLTRDSDLIIEEDEVDDLLATIQRELREREKGSAVRLEVSTGISKRMLAELQGDLKLEDNEIFYCEGRVKLSGLKTLMEDSVLSGQCYEAFTPLPPVEYESPEGIFRSIRKNDIFVHLPFHSFTIVEDFLAVAADDPKVLGIKMTLYRTGGKSPVLDSLIRAARNGKQVTTLVELKARFDEETNIQWAKKLEEEGIHVVYGLVKLKTHSKICMVLREEDNKIQRYVHLSTGNYNAITARLYTDMALFTNDKQIAEEVSQLFNVITGFSRLPLMNKLITAPGFLKMQVLQFIRRECKLHLENSNGRIIAKMNSLVDTDVIKELYRASQVGVQIDLIIRGICCLRPGVKGVSENIRVRSIVGRLLEHSRFFIFHNNGKDDLFFSSADWMPRNFNQRIETMFPIENEKIKNHVITELVPLYLSDNTKSRELLADGTYKHNFPQKDEQPVCTQEVLIEHSRLELSLREQNNFNKKAEEEKAMGKFISSNSEISMESENANDSSKDK